MQCLSSNGIHLPSSSELLNTAAAGGKSGFSSNPSSIEETGSDTGVFQTVTTLPSLSVTASGSAIEYGEAVTLTYVDVGLSGQNNVGDDTLRRRNILQYLKLWCSY